jgi:hypothetical protein
MWTVYSDMHIRKGREKFVIYQYCVEYCTLAGLYFLHTTFRVLADTFCLKVSYENLELETGPLYFPWINHKNTVLTHD